MPISEPSTAKSSEAPVAAQNLGSDLCTSCGLCCTGALHNAAVLDPDETEAARALGLPVLDSAKPMFSLPCPKLENDCCTIYGNRPRVCARYKCQLLRDLEAGSTDLPTALEHVEAAKQLMNVMYEMMPSGMTLRETRVLALGGEIDTGSKGREHMLLKLRATALHLYVDKFFRNSDEQGLFSLTSIREAAMGMEKS